MTGLLVVVALLAQGASHRTEGRVLQTTSSRAYLDAGSDDGLAAGAELVFRRAGTEVGRCRLEAVSLRSSSCGATTLRTGDAFALPARPAREEPRLLPAPTSPEQLRAQATLIAAAPIARVEFKPSARASEWHAGVAEVELSELAWVSTSAGPFVGTRADVSLRDADVGAGLRLDVAAQAIRWTSRPSDPAPRFRPRDASQLYVWQASVSRDQGSGLAVSAGRVLPWRIPGATILDGATAGWRAGEWELGAFAGFVPRPSTLGLVTDRSTGGGYWGWQRRLGKDVTLLDDGRVAVVRSPELGTRLEAETQAAARLGRPVDLSGSVRLGFGGVAKAPGNVDAARLGLSARPGDHLRLSGWWAYDGLEVPADAEPAIYAGHAQRVEGTVAWETPGLRVSALGGTSRDLGTRLDRRWVGPIVDLPRLLPGHGGVSLGYLEELGWSDGRSAWLQAIYRPLDRLRVVGRLSWSHASALAVMKDDLGAALSVAADLTRAISARLSVTARGPIPGLGAGEFTGGATAFATVVARY
jgi:hypothetical protein